MARVLSSVEVTVSQKEDSSSVLAMSVNYSLKYSDFTRLIFGDQFQEVIFSIDIF